jgi:hypothetical protein
MTNHTRRKFLKGLAYSSALSIGGLSGLAMAKPGKKTPQVRIDGSALPTCDIQLLPKQHFGTEVLTLSNHTNTDVTLDKITPINLEHVNNYLTIKVNKFGKHAGQTTVTLSPGERLELVVAAISSDIQGNTPDNYSLPIPNVLAGQLKVSSGHDDFNGIIPVTVFDSKAA